MATTTTNSIAWKLKRVYKKGSKLVNLNPLSSKMTRLEAKLKSRGGKH